jgi:hypothetical protein
VAFGSRASRRSDRLIEIDPGTGKQRTLLAGVEHRSLSAVAAGNAAVLRRNGDREQLLLVPLSIAITYEPVDGSTLRIER